MPPDGMSSSGVPKTAAALSLAAPTKRTPSPVAASMRAASTVSSWAPASGRVTASSARKRAGSASCFSSTGSIPTYGRSSVRTVTYPGRSSAPRAAAAFRATVSASSRASSTAASPQPESARSAATADARP